jgi:hypothetical protein
MMMPENWHKTAARLKTVPENKIKAVLPLTNTIRTQNKRRIQREFGA